MLSQRTRAKRFVRHVYRPLSRCLPLEAASGVVLLFAAAAALAWANSPYAPHSDALWSTQVGARLGDLSLTRSLAWCVNDVLMVVFFFVVGLEIRREVDHGERLEGGLIEGAALGVTGAVTVGLVLGRPLGVLAACELALRLRLAVLPLGLSWAHLSVLGVVAGIGFTMSLFVAHLPLRPPLAGSCWASRCCAT